MVRNGAVLLCAIVAVVTASAQNYLPKGSIFGGLRLGIGAKDNAFDVAVDGEYSLIPTFWLDLHIGFIPFPQI